LETFAVNGITKNLGNVINREATIGIPKSTAHRKADWIEKKSSKENSHETEDDDGKGATHAAVPSIMR